MAKRNITYADINMKESGKRIQACVQNAGYDVKGIQHCLHLSCPQPVYRWFQGRILPSVDHLLMLSRLLGVHMEELLVTDTWCREVDLEREEKQSREKRKWFYWENGSLQQRMPRPRL